MKSEYKKSILFLQEVVLFAIGIGMALLFWRDAMIPTALKGHLSAESD